VSERVGVGKIARMPLAIRREVYRRLADNEPASAIIEWIGTQTEAVRVLDAMFGGAAVSPQNLTEVRQGGEFKRFLSQREDLERTRTLAEFARSMAESAGGMSGGSVAILGGRIMEMLESCDPAEAIKLARAVSTLRDKEQNDRKLALRERMVSLSERQWLTKTGELILKYAHDARAQTILDSDASHADKLKDLVAYMEAEEQRR